MAHEIFTNMVEVTSSCRPPLQKTILDRILKICSLERADYLNPMFLGNVIPELLFNELLRVLASTCICM